MESLMIEVWLPANSQIMTPPVAPKCAPGMGRLLASGLPYLRGAGGPGAPLEPLVRAANRGPVGMTGASVERALRGLDKLSPLGSSDGARLEVAVRNEEGVE